MMRLNLKSFDFHGYALMRAKLLKKDLLALYYACRHPDTGVFPKIIIFIALGYALSPVDLIPDFIPVIGHVDDLIMIPTLIALSIKLIPAHVMEESRIKAEKAPLSLKKRWLFAFLFGVLWAAVIILVIYKIHSFFR